MIESAAVARGTESLTRKILQGPNCCQQRSDRAFVFKKTVIDCGRFACAPTKGTKGTKGAKGEYDGAIGEYEAIDFTSAA